MSTHTTLAPLLADISNTVQPVGGTNTHLGLMEMITMFMNQGRSVNGNPVPQVAITLTDGLSFQPTMTNQKAQEARDKGIHMIAVGVGDGINFPGGIAELQRIASDPVASNTFVADDFEGASQQLNAIKDAACCPGECMIRYLFLCLGLL